MSKEIIIGSAFIICWGAILAYCVYIHLKIALLEKIQENHDGK